MPASVPVGRYTKAVLEKAQLWPAIEAKMIGAQSVRQALDYVARGEVEAGFVYGTDAAIMPDKVKVAFTVPTDTPVLYPIAPVAASAERGRGAEVHRLRDVAGRPGDARQVRLRQALAPARRDGAGLDRARPVAEGGALGHRRSTSCSAWPSAMRLARHRFPGRELLDSILLLPMVLPPTVLGYYLLVLIGRRGWLGGWLERELRHPPDLHLAGRRARRRGGRLSLRLQVGARRLRDGRCAVRSRRRKVLGLGAAAIFFRVTLPLAWRGILAGALLAFARALGEFGATLMVAGSIPGKTQTLSIAVYEAVQAGQDDLANLPGAAHLGHLRRRPAAGRAPRAAAHSGSFVSAPR